MTCSSCSFEDGSSYEVGVGAVSGHNRRSSLERAAHVLKTHKDHANVTTFQKAYNAAGGDLMVTGALDHFTTAAWQDVLGGQMPGAASGGTSHGTPSSTPSPITKQDLQSLARTLQTNKDHANVTAFQKAYNAAGGDLRVNGALDHSTTAAWQDVLRGQLPGTGFAGLPRAGFGASAADLTAKDAAQTLMDAFSAGTVTSAKNNDVTNFQAAYNAMGGPQIKVDGLYGAQTQLALQSVLGSPMAAPATLVANAKGGSSPGAPGSATNPVNLDTLPADTTKKDSGPNYWLWALGAVAGGAGAYYGYKYYKRSR